MHRCKVHISPSNLEIDARRIIEQINLFAYFGPWLLYRFEWRNYSGAFIYSYALLNMSSIFSAPNKRRPNNSSAAGTGGACRWKTTAIFQQSTSDKKTFTITQFFYVKSAIWGRCEKAVFISVKIGVLTRKSGRVFLGGLIFFRFIVELY